MSRGTASTNLPREAILAAGAFTALGTGAIYMWSIFNKPLMEEFGFTTSEVSMIYSLSESSESCGSYTYLELR